MILVLLTGFAALFAIAAASVAPEVAAPAAAAGGALLALAALSAAHAREHLWLLLQRHAVAALAFLALAVAGVWTLNLFGPDWAAVSRWSLTLLGLGLAAPAAAGIASAYGRNALALTILIGAIPLAFAALLADGHNLSGALGRAAPALDAPGLSAAYGLIALLSLHVAADELRRRPAPGQPSLPPVARRLFAPLAALMTSFAMLTLAGAVPTLAATAAAALVFALVLWMRARRSRVGEALVPALMFVSAAAAGLAVLSASLAGERSPGDAASAALQSGVLQFLSHAGVIGIALLAGVFSAIIVVLALSKDRGRTPSRGAPLAAAFTAFGALLCWFAPGFAAPSAAFLLAVLTGLAISYSDLGSARKSSRR